MGVSASYIAFMDAQRLHYCHQLEREHIHLLLIDEASKGLDDIAAGRVKDARETIRHLKRINGLRTKVA